MLITAYNTSENGLTKIFVFTKKFEGARLTQEVTDYQSRHSRRESTLETSVRVQKFTADMPEI